MKISNEERQKRIDILKKEKEAFDILNDLSEIKKRAEQDAALDELTRISEELEIEP